MFEQKTVWQVSWSNMVRETLCARFKPLDPGRKNQKSGCLVYVDRPAIRKVCQQFVALCRNMDLLDGDEVAIDGSRFKAVNSKAKNYTRGKLRQKLGEIDKAVNPAKSACLTEITEVR